jgi:Flp pilus assembly protein TadD
LSFDPAGRFSTTAELVTALRGYCDAATRSVVVDQPLTQLPPPTQPSANRQRRAVLAAGLGLLGAGIGFAAYYSTRRPPVELLYQQAIDEYNDKKYENAVATFTKCLELKPGWPDALFGRGQSFRKLEKWHEARTDYTALKGANPAWAYALAGYCDIRLKDDGAARADLLAAYQYGQHDIAFLFNLARTQSNMQLHQEAEKIYAEILAVEPQNLDALRNRALAGVMIVVNQRTKIPSLECLADAEEYNRLAGDSFEGPFYAAVVFGEAARKDARFRAKAIDFLTLAFERGLPLEALANFSLQLKPLLPLVDTRLTGSAAHDPKYRAVVRPLHEYLDTPDWNQFLKGSQNRESALAQNRG